ncbi:PREDICTED: small ubiquitin-related modifier 3 [Condylura cristata]|uniref:small ubiquitin-related modifier 3 n=1 Tax=Condylura cristata TaxID=143302 RepID=UPI000642C0B8|nr:PREDICTED: small ubiquitin-related modifier 3 [Condylura cristata]
MSLPHPARLRLLARREPSLGPLPGQTPQAAVFRPPVLAGLEASASPGATVGSPKCQRPGFSLLFCRSRSSVAVSSGTRARPAAASSSEPQACPVPRAGHPREGVKTENDHINLKVAGQDGSVVQFKIKRHTPLSKLMKAYCERQGLSMRQIRFRFDGQPVNEADTPAQLEMEDEDTIDVFQQQTGGSGARGAPH